MTVEQPLADFQLAPGDLLDEAGGVLQRAESGKATLQKALQLGQPRRPRRPARQPQQGPDGRLGNRPLQVHTQAMDQQHLVAP